VLRGIFGPKRDEATGEWRKLRNGELRDLHSSPSIIRIIKSRRMTWAGHVARLERRGVSIGFWWESRKDNIKMAFRDIGRGGIDWIGLYDRNGWRALVNEVMNFRVS
jgi:hypothetical protein